MKKGIPQVESYTGSTLGAALRYAALGYPVFPCKPGSKEPITLHGFKDATTDPVIIAGWWGKYPTWNVAIATGTPGPDVLDVDTGPSGNGYEHFNRVKRTGLLAGGRMLVRTRSGGLHLYYKGTTRPCARLPRHFLDFKATGGYVLAPPSYVDADAKRGGPYELLDERDSDATLDWPAIRGILDPPRAYRREPWGDDTDITRLAGWVSVQPEGNRNAALYWAARCALETGNDPGVLLLPAMTAGLSELEARRTIDSATRASCGNA